MPCKPKVAELDLPCWRYQQILRLDVTVHDIFLVDEGDCSDELNHNNNHNTERRANTT